MHEKFKIKKDNHRSVWFRPILRWDIKHFSFSAIFDKSCLYTIGDVDMFDVNKLHGFSFGYHHENSFRIGWNCETGNEIDLYAYYYNNRQRVSIPLCAVLPGEKVTFEISVYRNQNLIDVIVDTDRGVTCYKKINFNFYGVSELSYLLYFYFGGNCVAPHDMFVTIKDF